MGEQMRQKHRLRRKQLERLNRGSHLWLRRSIGALRGWGYASVDLKGWPDEGILGVGSRQELRRMEREKLRRDPRLP